MCSSDFLCTLTKLQKLPLYEKISELRRIAGSFLQSANQIFFFENIYTVEPVYSGHLRFLEKVSAITRCPLYRGFQ